MSTMNWMQVEFEERSLLREVAEAGSCGALRSGVSRDGLMPRALATAVV
jgi:hypothetical protein